MVSIWVWAEIQLQSQKLMGQEKKEMGKWREKGSRNESRDGCLFMADPNHGAVYSHHACTSG